MPLFLCILFAQIDFPYLLTHPVFHVCVAPCTSLYKKIAQQQ